MFNHLYVMLVKGLTRKLNRKKVGGITKIKRPQVLTDKGGLINSPLFFLLFYKEHVATPSYKYIAHSNTQLMKYLCMLCV